MKKKIISYSWNWNFRRELGSLGSSEISGYMDILLSCVYDKYFLVEQYKNNVQLLEVYGLAKMKLETITKRVENSQNKLTRKYNRNIFSVSKNKLYLCFTRRIQSVNIYLYSAYNRIRRNMKK
ncbi:hypothetical protein RhiirA1_536078, partial [Rhizophagus irregularis]